MTTKTTQSAATRARPELRRARGAHCLTARRVGGGQWHRHSCLCAFAKPMTSRMAYAPLSRVADFLIANARLEFNVSHSKQNLLKISNRERIAIFHPHFHTLAQEGRWPTTRPPKVQPCLHPLYSSFQPRASSLQNLIANPELESRLTYRKLSPLKISNRKFLAIFYLASHSPLACPDEDHRRRRVAQFLIANARLEFPANHTKQSTATKSNRERIAIFHLAFRANWPRLTQHSPLRVTGRGTPVAGHELRVTSHGQLFAPCGTRRKSAFLGFRRCAMLQSRATQKEGTEEK